MQLLLGDTCSPKWWESTGKDREGKRVVGGSKPKWLHGSRKSSGQPYSNANEVVSKMGDRSEGKLPTIAEALIKSLPPIFEKQKTRSSKLEPELRIEEAQRWLEAVYPFCLLGHWRTGGRKGERRGRRIWIKGCLGISFHAIGIKVRYQDVSKH